MKASGNGDPMQCVSNLIRIVRGENPYERCKGLDPRLIDKPYSVYEEAIRKDVLWNIRTYEPRVDVDKVDINALLEQQGHFAFAISANKGGRR